MAVHAVPMGTRGVPTHRAPQHSPPPAHAPCLPLGPRGCSGGGSLGALGRLCLRFGEGWLRGTAEPDGSRPPTLGLPPCPQAQASLLQVPSVSPLLDPLLWVPSLDSPQTLCPKHCPSPDTSSPPAPHISPLPHTILPHGTSGTAEEWAGGSTRLPAPRDKGDSQERQREGGLLPPGFRHRRRRQGRGEAESRLLLGLGGVTGAQGGLQRDRIGRQAWIAVFCTLLCWWKPLLAQRSVAGLGQALQ